MFFYVYYYLYIYTMKKFLLILIFFCASIAIRIEVGSTVQLIEKIQLICSGNKGNVVYQAQTLPPGVRLTGSKLQIFDKTQINGGVFPVRIKAIDQSGAEDQKIIVLTLRNQGQQRQQIINKQNIGNTKNTPSISVSISQIYPNNSPNNGPMPVPGSSKFSNVITPSSPTYNGISSSKSQQKDKNIENYTNNLLNQLSVPGKVSNQHSDVNTLKSRIEEMPTNADPNLLNYAPLIISTNRASTAHDNRRPINSNNVKFRDAFMRQSNAGLSIGNLLTIVQQAKSNRNAAIEQVAKRQQLLIQARKKVGQSSTQSQKIQNDYNRLSLGIRGLTQSINDFKKKQEQIENLSRQKPYQKQAISDGIATSQTKLNNINFLISQKQKIYNQVKQQKQMKDQECNNLQNQVQNIYKEKQKKIAEVSSIPIKIIQAKRKMEMDRANVNDLKQKLAKAQAQFKQSERASSDLQNQQKQLKIYFLKYDSRLNDTKARSAACPTQSNQIDEKLKSMQTQQLGKMKEQKSRIEKELGSLNDQLSKINTDIATFPKQIQFYKLQVKQLEPKLLTLRQQFEISQRNVISAKGNGVDADGQVKNAQANLQAALARFKSQEAILQQGNKNLALARAEKVRADEVIEQMIRQGADVELYGTTNPQSTLGISNPQSNNPQNSNINNKIDLNKNQNINPNNNRQTPNQNQQIFNIPDYNQLSNNVAITANGPYPQTYRIDNPTSFVKNNVISDYDNRLINTNPNININDNYFSMDNQIRNIKDNFNTNIEQSKNIIPTVIPTISSTYIPSQISKSPLSTKTQDQIPLLKQIKFDQNLDFMRPNSNGTYQINSISEFIIRQFDPLAKPPTDIKSTTLYPLNFPTTPDIDFNSLQANTSLKSFVGYVIGVGQNFLSLLSDDTNIYEVSYLPNMKAFSTQQNSKIEIGRKIIVRGYLQKPLNILTLLLLSISE